MTRSSIRVRRVGTVLAAAWFVLLVGGTAWGTEDPLSDAVVPRPGLLPGEVVWIQLEALRHNDDEDRGIEVAFRFASPANREQTGPLPRFVRMIRQGPYALMLDFREASYGRVEVREDVARQRVTLTRARSRVSYWFYLSRQSKAPFAGCWMTDAVFVEPAPGAARVARGRTLALRTTRGGSP